MFAVGSSSPVRDGAVVSPTVCASASDRLLQSAANFECEVSGNVGFNIAAMQAERMIDELRQRKQRQRSDQQQQGASAGQPATGDAADAERKEEEKSLLVVKKKKVEQQ